MSEDQTEFNEPPTIQPAGPQPPAATPAPARLQAQASQQPVPPAQPQVRPPYGGAWTHPQAQAPQEGSCAQPPAGGWGPPPGQAYAPRPYPQPAQPVRRSSGWRTFLWVMVILILGFSVVMNVILLGVVGAQFGGFESNGPLVARQMYEGGDSSQTVAVYNVSGVIDGASVAQFKQFYNTVANNKNVKAVVLRIDSPGGGVTASDEICNMVKKLKDFGKTVVVSMGSVAASGGYYISAPADEIFAEKTTITGSIGVITGWYVFKGTMDKIGAEQFTIKSTNAQMWKDEMSPTARPHQYQLEHIQSVLDAMQTRFESVVKQGRGTRLTTRTETVTIAGKDGTPAVTRKNIEPFNGKIYLADDALTLGLIDQIGYEEAAITKAATLAGLTDSRVVRYTRRRSFMESLLDGKANGSIQIDRKLIDQLQTPKFMMLWKAE